MNNIKTHIVYDKIFYLDVESEYIIGSNKKHGETRYYNKGILVKLDNYINGIQHGISLDYYDNGEIWIKREIVNGHITTKCKYDKNGVLYNYHQYKKNKLIGLSKDISNGLIYNIT